MFLDVCSYKKKETLSDVVDVIYKNRKTKKTYNQTFVQIILCVWKPTARK